MYYSHKYGIETEGGSYSPRNIVAFEKGTRPNVEGLALLGSLFIVGVGRLSVAFTGRAVVISGKSAKIHSFMAQRILFGMKLNAQLMSMRVRFI